MFRTSFILFFALAAFGLPAGAIGSFGKNSSRLEQAKSAIIRDWGLMNPLVVKCENRSSTLAACDIYYQQRLCRDVDGPQGTVAACHSFLCLESFLYDFSKNETSSEVSYGCE